MLLYNDQDFDNICHKEWFVVLMLAIVGVYCANQHSIHGGTCCIGETHVEFDIGLMKEMNGEEVRCLWC